jgi:hypothetical protein
MPLAFFTPLTLYGSPGYANTLYETLLEASGPQGSLKGTLLSPCPKPEHVILIIPGSGPLTATAIILLGLMRQLIGLWRKIWR